MNPVIPVPRVPISIRPATLTDLPFIDQLQKMHSKRVGWMPTQQLEGKIRTGQVSVAESVKHEDMKHEEESPSSCFMSSCFTEPLGYCIGHDQYCGARELRDRWLERVNGDRSVMLAEGKYDVSRVFPNGAISPPPLPTAILELPALPAAVAAQAE